MERWERINLGPDDAARAELQICCGSRRWIDRMMTRRPFATREAARSAAREEWFALGPTDWREAFEHHPRIGERTTSAISAREQAHVADANEDRRHVLIHGNREYEGRFGYIYIVCATGKSPDEMIAILLERLKNDPETEIKVAAEEHARICDLRLSSRV